MTEESLVAEAIAHNPTLKASQWERSVAEAQVKAVSVFSNPVLKLESVHTQSENNGWGVGLAWTPPQPAEWSARRAGARAHVSEVRSELEEDASNLEASARGACATADALREQIDLANKAVEMRTQIQTMIRERVEHGASTRLDLNVAGLALARAEQERDALVVQRTTLVRSLAAVAGLPPGAELDLAPSPRPSLDASATADPKLVESDALARRPLLKADVARAEMRDQAVRAEKSKQWPWFTFSAIPRVRIHDSSAPNPVDLSFGIDVVLPIFDGNGGNVQAAEAERSRQVDLRAAHVAGVRRDLDVALAEVALRREILIRYRSTIEPVLAEHGALLKEALIGRQVDIVAILGAEDMVLRSQREYSDAWLAYRKATIELQRASGALTAKGR